MNTMNTEEKLNYVTGILQVALGSVCDYSSEAVLDCMEFMRSHTKTFVVGFREPDEEYCRMKVNYDCHCELDRDPPPFVKAFFQLMGHPDDAGAEVSLDDAVQPWEGFLGEGYELHLDKLPRNVKVVRFINSWAP
jgi:hypothetical protein